MNKLRSGILCLETPQGTRHIRPTFMQRLQLLWIFRHFNNVPFTVLNHTQTELIQKLRSEGQFVHVESEVLDVVLLGTIEYAEVQPQLPERKSPHRVTSASSTGSFMNPRSAKAMPER